MQAVYHNHLRPASCPIETRRYPPQILLTSCVMAELMAVLPEDQRFLDRVTGGLRFLVFDELHTSRGRRRSRSSSIS